MSLCELPWDPPCTHFPANNAMQGPQGPCTGNCAGPVRAARTGPVSIWPRVPKCPHMGLTARVSWRLNADFLHDVFWRCNADFLHGFYDDSMPIFCTTFFGGVMPIFCTVFMMVQCRFPARVSWWFNTSFLYGFHGGIMPISCAVFIMV